MQKLNALKIFRYQYQVRVSNFSDFFISDAASSNTKFQMILKKISTYLNKVIKKYISAIKITDYFKKPLGRRL